MRLTRSIVLILLLAAGALAAPPNTRPFVDDIRPSVSYSRGSLRVDIVSIEEIPGGISVYARAFKGVKQIGLGTDGRTDLEHFQFFNIDPYVIDTSVIVGTDSDGLPVYGAKLDAALALSEAIIDAVRITGKPDAQVKVGSVGRTTSTFYPDPAVETTSVDGYTEKDYASGGGQVWATLRAAAGSAANDSVASSAAALRLRSDTGAGNWRTHNRSIYGFDTSALPDTDVISSATFSLSSTAKTDNFSQSVVVDRRVPATATALVAADFDVGGWAGVEQASNRITLAAWSIAGYNDFTLNATGISNVSLTGVSWYGTRTSADFDNVEPTWAASTIASATIVYADTAGTTTDPKLVVVHTTPSTFVPQIIISP